MEGGRGEDDQYRDGTVDEITRVTACKQKKPIHEIFVRETDAIKNSYLRPTIICTYKFKQFGKITHFTRINFSDFRNSCLIIDRKSVRGRLLASTIFSEKWIVC